jgi:spermidine synthase
VSARVFRVALLLLCSGACALIYQTVWFREFRLVFGASTAASAAVLAIFMGGLGAGGLILGRRCERSRNPLAYYAHLEIAIAVTAGITPGLVWLIRELYVLLGGTIVLGMTLGSVVRLLFAAVVLAVPTFLMGGTLPAAARAVETATDVSRRHMAFLYGLNTLGAVTGAALSTFLLVETFGNHRTLWLAALSNVLVGMVARNMAKGEAAEPAESVEVDGAGVTAAVAPASFVLTSAAAVGFAFFLMEIVWYRMLGPLLGGSTFTFGLILAVALFGVGLGGAAYALLAADRPATLLGFAATCAVEALALAAPYALGDRIAVLASLLRQLGAFGFSGQVLGWTTVTAVVVLPASLVAGVQFPMLIALLGRGRREVGRHVGQAYAWNTVGAIAGSLIGGFGVLPLLTAPGVWRAVVVLLAVLGAASCALAVLEAGRSWRVLTPALAAVLAVALTFANGPTAAWRHSPIGAGRADLVNTNPTELRNWINARRRVIAWEADGVESSVGLYVGDGYAFVVNGKIDGNARGDAATQVVSGLLGAALHPEPKRAFVIGLGTGSTAGWLGAVPSIEQVDVVELEPAILHIARLCAPVNQSVLANPKVRTFIGDAREALLTTPERYDVIFSEPSNPYRAGIANLFTAEFYRSAAERLSEDGLFVQWVQSYEIDNATAHTIFATIGREFPAVEVWQSTVGDMLLIASRRRIVYDAGRLRERIQLEPYRSAFANAWRVDDLEGVLAHYVGGDRIVRDLAVDPEVDSNTDDRNIVEFGFARSVGRTAAFRVDDLRRAARNGGYHRPEVIGGSVDWQRVERQYLAFHGAEGVPALEQAWYDQHQRALASMYGHYVKKDYRAALQSWRAHPATPVGSAELAIVAFLLADAGDEACLLHCDQLRLYQPAEADAIVGRLRWRQGRLAEATEALEVSFTRYSTDPWPLESIMGEALATAEAVAGEDKSRDLSMRLYEATRAPFAVSLLNERRLVVLLNIARDLMSSVSNEYVHAALDAYGPHVPWELEFLETRAVCYEGMGDRRFDEAKRDLDDFKAGVSGGW